MARFYFPGRAWQVMLLARPGQARQCVVMHGDVAWTANIEYPYGISVMEIGPYD